MQDRRQDGTEVMRLTLAKAEKKTLTRRTGSWTRRRWTDVGVQDKIRLQTLTQKGMTCRVTFLTQDPRPDTKFTPTH